MTMLKLVIFDCDGVMFDSMEANRLYYNHILNNFGHPPMNDEETLYVHTHYVVDSIRHIFRDFPEDYEKAEQYRKKVDYSPYLRFMQKEPDLVEFLNYLRPKYKMAISTNRSTTMSDVLDLFELRQYFDKVVTSLDVKNSKPHPEALYTILDYFHLSAEQAIYIGDSLVDQEHCSAADMRLIAFRNANLDAEYHVDSFMEIIRLPIF